MSLGTISLGNFVLDLRQQSLVHRGAAIPLRQKTWLVLRLLAERPGELLSTDELHESAWPGLAVTPQTLTNVISELRKVTRLDPEGSLRIETRYGRGYRLVVNPHQAAYEEAPSAALEPPAALFVGRSDEMAKLRGLWTRALAGKRQIVFIAGGAGIGKTTLIEEIVRSLRQDSAATGEIGVGRGRCIVGEGETEAYAPLLDALEEISHGIDLTEDLRRYAPSWLAQMPWLLPSGEMMALRQSLAGTGALRLRREGVRLIEELSLRLPLVLVLEDLHGADAATIDLLAALSERSAPARLLLLASYRPSDAFLRGGLLPALPRRAQRPPSVTRLLLDPLSPAAIDAYLAGRLGGARFDDAITAALEEKSGGNPLFLREILDTAIERGWLREDGDRWRFAAPAEALGAMLPDGVRELVRDHLERLPANRIEVLEAASAAGADFTVSLVAAALDRPADEIARECRALAEHSHFVVDDGERAMPDGSVVEAYRFAHVLYQQAMGERLTPSLRRPLHARLGDQLEREYAGRVGEIAARLARHFEIGEQHEKELLYLQMAAMGAGERRAYREAADLVARAIAVTEKLPASPMLGIQRCELLLVHGNIEIMLGGYRDETARADYDRALAEASRHGDLQRRFRAQLGRSISALFRGAVDAEEIAADLRATADEHPELGAVGYLYGSYVTQGRGDVRTFVVEVHKAASLLPRAAPGIPQGVCLEAHVERQLAEAMTLTGDLAAAALHCERAVALLRERAIPADRMSSLANLAPMAVMARAAERALVLAEESIAVGEEFGIDRLPLPLLAPTCRAWAQSALRRAPLEAFEEMIEQRRESGEGWCQSLFLLTLVELQMRDGLLGRARTCWQRAVALQPHENMWLAEEQRLAGELLLAEQGPSPAARAEAAKHFEQAVRLARRQGALLFETRAQAQLEENRQA